jgi:Transcription factor WhiB
LTLVDVLWELKFYTYENEDWGDYANCKGLDFISKPQDAAETSRRASICAACPVSDECSRWSDRLHVTGVFVVGEWRG